MIPPGFASVSPARVLMAKHLIISGRVQGVGFRTAMCDEAERLGVTGWVRNRRDGTVEAVVDGDPAAVAAIIAWAKAGPPGARVTGVAVGDAEGRFLGFQPRSTL
jgi:acylphosphatase